MLEEQILEMMYIQVRRINKNYETIMINNWVGIKENGKKRETGARRRQRKGG